MLHRNLTQVLSSWYILLLLVWEALPWSLFLWGKKRQSFISSSLIPLLVLIFVNSHVEFSWGKGQRFEYFSKLSGWCNSYIRRVAIMQGQRTFHGIWGEMCSKWGKAEIRAVICQIRENSIHWSCFRNLFISTCVGAVSQAGFFLSNTLLVS